MLGDVGLFIMIKFPVKSNNIVYCQTVEYHAYVTCLCHKCFRDRAKELSFLADIAVLEFCINIDSQNLISVRL